MAFLCSNLSFNLGKTAIGGKDWGTLGESYLILV